MILISQCRSGISRYRLHDRKIPACSTREPFSALLVCRDNASQKWGPRWLRQSGLETILITDPEKALSTARSTRPHVIVVEASLKDKSGSRLFQVFQDAADVMAPVIALCTNTKEVLAAVEADVYDVVRKPVEWQLTGRRALQAANSSGQRRAARRGP